MTKSNRLSSKKELKCVRSEKVGPVVSDVPLARISGGDFSHLLILRYKHLKQTLHSSLSAVVTYFSNDLPDLLPYDFWVLANRPQMCIQSLTEVEAQVDVVLGKGGNL